MALTPGSSIGAFTVTSLLGSGGMGDVYRARDTRLNREVAIKVLPDLFARDPERLGRFRREAQVLASLNHPNVGSIYGLEESGGTCALVLELVEGPTLADHIARGALAVDEALQIAAQIANALEAAHERGIIHRDLKPANIKVRPDGTVKVLDFGLAKLTDSADIQAASDLSVSPTITAHGTFAGTILGTAAYMSPEQARGKPLDHRTDIWAFGCVLFEMLTAKKAFPAGETVSDAIASVLTREPDFTLLPPATPASVKRVLKRALTKNPRERLSHIVDARLDLQEAAPTPDAANTPDPPAQGRRTVAVAAAAVVVASALTGFGTWMLARRDAGTTAPRVTTRFTIGLPRDQALTGIALLDLSPDGRKLVYAANDRLYVRDLARLEPTAIADASDRADMPVFSPDGQFIAYATRLGAGSVIQRVPAGGGNPTKVCTIPDLLTGLRWVGNRLLFSHAAANGGIYEVSANGGTPRLLVAAADGETIVNPDLLPDGKTLVYAMRARGSRTLIVAQPLEGGQRRTIFEDANLARILPSGHLIFSRGSNLIVQPFSMSTMTVSGAPQVVDANLNTNPSFGYAAMFAVSSNGTLAYVTAPQAERRLVWVDRDGREQPINAEPKAYIYPRISPDGTKIALNVHDKAYSIWVWNIAAETLNRVTSDQQDVRYALWTPDSKRLIYSLVVPPSRQLMSIPADGSGRAEPLSDTIANQYPTSISPDGKYLVFREGPAANFKLMLLSLDAGRQARPLLERGGALYAAEISPNGKWLAYQAGAPGASEVFVQPFPNVDDGRWQVSSRGGSRPFWSPDSRELYYLNGDGARLSMAPIGQGSPFSSGRPVDVLDLHRFVASFPIGGGDVGRTMDVHPDGRRFLMLSPVNQASPEIVVADGWVHELTGQ